MDYSLFKEIGTSAIVAIPLFFLIRWTTNEFNRALTCSREERKIWAEIMLGYQKCITEHTEQAKSFHINVQLEHEKMLKALESACLEHKEIALTLGRINGYKHE